MENKMDLIVSEFQVPKIEIKNKEQIKDTLRQELKRYNVALTEETLKTGKDYRAQLRKVKNSIEDKRKEVKKQIMIPYEKIENDFKEITILIDESINNLDKQVKSFEEKQKEDKMKKINELEKLNDTGIKFFNTRWLNATYDIDDIAKEIKEFVQKTNQDLELLKDEDVVVKDFYKKTLNISATLIEKKRIEELRKKEEENQKNKEIKQEKKELSIDLDLDEEDEEIEIKSKINLELNINRNELLKVKAFFTENNIEYELIEIND